MRVFMLLVELIAMMMVMAVGMLRRGGAEAM
jgi:hypothetical protein